MNQYTHAIYYYQQATTHRPDDSRMWVALAAVYVKNSDSGNGLKAYNRALKLMDDGDDNLGHVLYSLGDLYTDVDDERTVYFYSCAVAVDSNVNEKSRACLWLERYYHEQGDREKERIWRAELDGF